MKKVLLISCRQSERKEETVVFPWHCSRDQLSTAAKESAHLIGSPKKERFGLHREETRKK